MLTIYQHKNIGVVLIPGIGAPVAAVILEMLIAMGGKNFINIGSAGGLGTFGVFVCNKALRDEGTSYHYLPPGDFVFPDKSLTRQLAESLTRGRLQFACGASWTTDAPYRETKPEITKFMRLGIKTVEMEASALFAVAKVRKVKVASAFVISDLLNSDKRIPRFGSRNTKSTLKRVFVCAVNCLKKRIPSNNGA